MTSDTHNLTNKDTNDSTETEQTYSQMCEDRFLSPNEAEICREFCVETD